jgi:hypothetical protein
VPLTVEGLRGAWPDVAAQARQQGPLVGTLFDVLVPREVSESTVTLEISEGHDHMAEGARRQRPAIESVLARALGRSIRVALAAPPGAEPRGVRPKLLSSKDLQDERLRELRGLDPALDAAADALDLEILE